MEARGTRLDGNISQTPSLGSLEPAARYLEARVGSYEEIDTDRRSCVRGALLGFDGAAGRRVCARDSPIITGWRQGWIPRADRRRARTQPRWCLSRVEFHVGVHTVRTVDREALGVR